MNEESEDLISSSDARRANQNEVKKSIADRLSHSDFQYSRNEQEILESLEKINKEYDQKERFKKYYEVIDQNELAFTTWLPYQQIEREFIYKWLERWDVIPEKVLESIVRRYDYYLFYDTMAKKRCFLPFLTSILHIRDIFSDDINIVCSIISLKENQTDFIDYLKNLYDGYKYQKHPNWVSTSLYAPIKQLKYIKNLLFLLVNIYKRSNNFFVFQWIILFYDLSVFNITNSNKFQNCRSNMIFINLVSSIHKYMFFNFLNEYCFKIGLFSVSTIYGSIDLVQELIILYSKSYIQIGSESILEILSEIFNFNYYKLNILQRVNIVQCINHNISYHNDNENLFIGFNDLDLDLLQQLYVDSNKLDDHMTHKLNILLFMISIVQKADKQIKNKKFIYYFTRDIFRMLDDLGIYCDLYEELLESGDQSEYFEQCRCHLSNTNGLLEAYSNIILVEKGKLDSVFYSSELKKKIIDGCSIHIKTLHNMKNKYHVIQSKTTDFNVIYYINILMNGILLYKHTDRFEMYMNMCKTTLVDIENDIAQNNTEFKRYLNRAKLIPEELDETKIDAITMEVLYDPITLPTSKMIVNRDTIKLHLYESDCDPFTKIKFTQKEIEEFNK
jgi:hypothetical protein